MDVSAVIRQFGSLVGAFTLKWGYYRALSPFGTFQMACPDSPESLALGLSSRFSVTQIYSATDVHRRLGNLELSSRYGIPAQLCHYQGKLYISRLALPTGVIVMTIVNQPPKEEHSQRNKAL